MDIKNIKTFVRAAELGNFTKAASELGYTQSTVTLQIQQLEAELHTSLFSRNGKRIMLSAEGKDFLKYAYQIIKYESLAVEHFSPTDEPMGELKIGIMETICASHYTDLFQSFQQLYPLVSLRLQIVTTHQALEGLDRGTFDVIYLLDNRVTQPDKIVYREYPADICFFAASSHPLTKEPSVSLDRLLQERFILTEEGCNYRQVFENDLAARGTSLNCVTEIGYTPYILHAVSTQNAISLLPAITLHQAFREGKIAPITVDNYSIRMSIQVIYSDRRRIAPPLKAFLDYL